MACGQRDLKARLVLLRIALRSEHDAAGGALTEAHHVFAERSSAHGEHDLQKIAREKGQHDLRFGIAEAAVVFDDLRSVLREHEPEIEAALEGAPFRLHRADGGQENVFHALFCDLFRVIGIGRDGAHAARVEPFVAVFCALVVYRRKHGNDDVAVRE